MDRARDVLIPRLTTARREIDFDADFLKNPANGVPLWRGDLVEIAGYATAPLTWSRWRILELTMRAESETPGRLVRRASYRAEFVAEGEGE